MVRINPMLPTLARAPFSYPDWLFQPKWDGYRALCYFEAGSIRFVSRNRKSLTERFPELLQIGKAIKATTAIIDGEIVAIDKAGTLCFAALGASERNDRSVVFYAFDLLCIDGKDLTQEPLRKRKAALKRILPKRDAVRLCYTEHVVGDGERLFNELEKRQLEGLVPKRCDSIYVGGRTRAWLKIQNIGWPKCGNGQ